LLTLYSVRHQKRPVIQAFDDLEYAEHDKALVPAEHAVTLIVREGSEETAVELDLTGANHALPLKRLESASLHV
jgi:hypothetical protein